MEVSNAFLPHWFTAGGPAMWVLFVLSVLSVATVLGRTLVFALQGPGRTRIADRLLAHLAHGETGSARDLADQARTPVDRVVARGLIAADRLDPASTAWQEEMQRIAREQLESFRSGLRLLELTAAVAPLIGLLGTVFGMIEAFQQLETAGSRVDPAALSGGIWEALVTTAAGLVVAIPALAGWHLFDRVLERARYSMEDRLTRLRPLLTGEESPSARPEPSEPRATTGEPRVQHQGVAHAS